MGIDLNLNGVATTLDLDLDPAATRGTQLRKQARKPRRSTDPGDTP